MSLGTPPDRLCRHPGERTLLDNRVLRGTRQFDAEGVDRALSAHIAPPGPGPTIAPHPSLPVNDGLQSKSGPAVVAVAAGVVVATPERRLCCRQKKNHRHTKSFIHDRWKHVNKYQSSCCINSNLPCTTSCCVLPCYDRVY